MSGDVTEHSWTEKGTRGSRLPGHLAIAWAGLIALVLTYFKLRPYLNPEAKVHAFSQQDQAQHLSVSQTRKEEDIKDSILKKILPGLHLGAKGMNPNRSSSNRATHSTHVRIIERPLFDGLSVTVRAKLIRGVSSLESDSRVEAELESLVKEEGTQELDDSAVRGSKLLGLAIPNFDLKRMVLNFSELVTRDGRSIAILSTAIDPETQTQGVNAHYASGMGSRLLGVGISQILTAGDQVLMAKLLPDPSGANITQQATSQAARQMNDQAATDLSLETTKGLRETKPELRLPAGTPITLRLRIAPQATEAGGGS